MILQRYAARSERQIPLRVFPATLRGKAAAIMTSLTCWNLAPTRALIQPTSSSPPIATPGRDGCDRRLVPMRVRYAKYGNLGNAGVLACDLLDIARVDVHSTGNDHVLLAVTKYRKPSAST